RSPCLLKLHADSGYRGPRFQEELKKVFRKINGGIAKRTGGRQIRRPARAMGGGRTTGWLDRCRRLAKDRECLNQTALAFL
ncbi:MAG: IS5/IS1182 family transposase, partial [Rhodobacterales bacterium]|nr:IS5/IS1182 family transposase [Rhodobacterales bacterium]